MGTHSPRTIRTRAGMITQNRLLFSTELAPAPQVVPKQVVAMHGPGCHLGRRGAREVTGPSWGKGQI